MTTQTQPCRTYAADDPRDLAFLAGAQATLAATDAMITGLMKRQNDARQQLRIFERALAEKRAELQLDTQGKNAEQRAAELIKALRVDLGARGLEAAIDEKQIEIAGVAVDLDAATRRRTTTLAVLNYAANWLRYSAT